MKKQLFIILALLFLFPAFTLQAQASIISLDYDYEFAGEAMDVNRVPWLNATFSDGGLGTVTLTFQDHGRIDTDTGLLDDEYVGNWYFNFDPSLNPDYLLFEYDSYNSTIEPDQISTGVNEFKADGDGSYDIRFEFPKSSANRFGVDDIAVFNITYNDMITADSFYHLSEEGGGNDTWYAAAHVQSIGQDDQYSGWIAPSGGTAPIPEPATMLLLGTGLIGLAGIGRKKLMGKSKN